MKKCSQIFLFFIYALFMLTSTASLASTKSADSMGQTISDSVITTKVKSQLAANSATSATAIGVETNQGVVTLSGTASSDTEANAAVQIAESTKGVKSVNTDNLTVKDSSQPMQDSYITAKVKGIFIREKLFSDTNIPVTSIKVETQNGVVYLSGDVRNQTEETRAKELAQSISGVNQVISNLQVKNRGA